MTAYLAHHPISSGAGMRMFQAVIVFGVATVVFALSQLVPLPLAALGIADAADTTSVVIRISLVQLATLDTMRGRVGAVLSLHQRAEPTRRIRERYGRGASGALPATVFGFAGKRPIGDCAPSQAEESTALHLPDASCVGLPPPLYLRAFDAAVGLVMRKISRLGL